MAYIAGAFAVSFRECIYFYHGETSRKQVDGKLEFEAAILTGVRNASRVALHAPGGRNNEGKVWTLMNVMDMF